MKPYDPHNNDPAHPDIPTIVAAEKHITRLEEEVIALRRRLFMDPEHEHVQRIAALEEENRQLRHAFENLQHEYAMLTLSRREQ
jgi:hypothetical protein